MWASIISKAHYHPPLAKWSARNNWVLSITMSPMWFHSSNLIVPTNQSTCRPTLVCMLPALGWFLALNSLLDDARECQVGYMPGQAHQQLLWVLHPSEKWYLRLCVWFNWKEEQNKEVDLIQFMDAMMHLFTIPIWIFIWTSTQVSACRRGGDAYN